ncbi:MAG: NAD-dependent protein deacetylase SIR2 family [Treponematales bacterium]
MSSPNKTSAYTARYWDSIRQASRVIQNTDCVLAGVGAGMTAAGGLCYADTALAEKWYPEYVALGKKSILEIMSDFWPTTINDHNAAAFWGFWVRHIYHLRYEPDALPPYRALFSIIGGREHFICSTNVDGQLEKAGFDRKKIFAPQGDYALLQCRKPCSQRVFDNKSMIETCLANMASPFEIREADIPRCPVCGDFLIPNLRCDARFVEAPHLWNTRQYEAFIQDARGKRLVLLELGVGFNTPGIIRFPFESITAQFARAILIRVNLSDAAVPEEIQEKSIVIQDDIAAVLNRLQQSCGGGGV